MLIQAGRSPKAIIPFAPPKPGFGDFAAVLLESGSILRSYANAGDPVPDVPLYLPGFEYVHPAQPLELREPPDQEDRSPLACHHIGLYVRGLELAP